MSLFSDEQILELLKRSNPWWQGEHTLRELPPIHRAAYREVLETVTAEDVRRFAVLSGARRVGKTTVLLQVARALLERGVPAENILYISFDDPILKLSGFAQVLETYRSYIPHTGVHYFLLDEVQYAEDWSLWVKRLYDSEPALRLAATGSASPSIEKGASDSGVGRWRVFRMPTLTFAEYCAVAGVEDLPQGVPTLEELPAMERGAFGMLMMRLSSLQPHWNRYLVQGGFPELVHLQDTARAQQLLREDVVDKVLKRDVPALFDVRNSVFLEKIYLYLCLKSGNIINYAEMSKALGVTKPTLSRYIDYLRDANLIYISHSVLATGKKGLSAQPKIYIADAALRNASLALPNPFSDSADLGMVVETAVYKHFQNAYARSAKVGYLRTPGKGKEVDVAVDFFPHDKFILCEAKYRNDAELAPGDALPTLCREGRAAAAFVATKSANDFTIMPPFADSGTPIVKIPAFALCYLLNARYQ